jgi:hypothetical protein
MPNETTTPSLNEPAPTPGWAESSPGGTPRPTSEAAGAHRPAHAYVLHHARHSHYAWRDGHRNPVAAAADGVVGGMADLGSLAAYPIYCFPRYGSCPVYRPYP